MNEYAVIIQAIAALLWPLFAFTALFAFKSQIKELAKRLKKGKFFGQEIELGESLEKLAETTASAESDLTSLPGEPFMNKSAEDNAKEQDIVRKILSEAAQSPKAALISLASELDRLAREVLATTGHLNGRRLVPVQQAIGELHNTFGLSSHVPSSLYHFWDVRNRVIHRGEGNDEDILRAIDSGISILKALQAMPREINIVHEPNVPIFSDAELTTPVTVAHGLILETHSPGGASKSFRIFPTTRSTYIKGKRVSWEWSMGLVLGQAWYRDIITGKPTKAWDSSAEFVGRHLDEL